RELGFSRCSRSRRRARTQAAWERGRPAREVASRLPFPWTGRKSQASRRRNARAPDLIVHARAAAGRRRSPTPKLGTTADNPPGPFVSATFPCFYAARIVLEGTRMNDVTGKLTGEQALLIVERLCRKGGDVRDAIVAEAIPLLSEFSLDETADEVFD